MATKRWILVGILFLLVTGCTAAPASPTLVKVRVTILPILEQLPVLVAQREGLFKSRGIEVELITSASGAERDQLVMAGQADGMVNEVLTTLFINKEKPQVQIVRYARTATRQNHLFRILAARDSGIKVPSDLKGVEIGISDATVIAYLTDRLLEKEGFTPREIKTVGIPKVPDRLALLQAGKLKASMLPDPTSELAAQAGAAVVIDDTRWPEISFSTYSFRITFIEQNPKAVKAFLAGLEEATRQINKSPNQWRPLLVENNLLPAALAGTYQVPPFAAAGVPGEAQFADVVTWAKGKGLLNVDVPYTGSVNSTLLP